MKNLTLPAIIVFVLFAPDTHAQIFGIRTGLSLSTMLMKNSDLTYSDKLSKRQGFQFGPIVDLPMEKMVSFETGLLFTGKGFKLNNKRDQLNTSDDVLKANLLYLDIPLTLKLTVDLSDSKLFGVFGPYVGIGLKGTAKCDGDCSKDKEDIKFGNDEDIKRMDAGLTMGAGVEITPLQISGTYNVGLANLSTNTYDPSEKVKNRVWMIAITLRFGNHRKDKNEKQLPSSQ